MQSSKPLVAAVQQLLEVLMRRSMRDFFVHTKEAGIPVGQLSTLMWIHRKGASAVSAIGDDLGITKAAASQMLERLVQHGFISRSEDAHDRRVRQIQITPKGRQVLAASFKAREAWLEALVATLTPAEQAQVAAALQLLTEKATQIEALPPPAP